MSLPVSEAFTGAVGDLSGYTLWTALRPMGRDGTGLGVRGAGAGSGDAIVYWPTATDTFGNDQYSQIVAKTTGPGDGTKYIYLLARVTSTFSNGSSGGAYWFWTDGGSDTAINKCVAGVVTSIGTANTTTFVSGDVFKLECIGTAIKAYKNGSVIISLTDSAVASGQPGFGANDASGAMRVDDWIADLASAGGDTLMGMACL